MKWLSKHPMGCISERKKQTLKERSRRDLGVFGCLGEWAMIKDVFGGPFSAPRSSAVNKGSFSVSKARDLLVARRSDRITVSNSARFPWCAHLVVDLDILVALGCLVVRTEVLEQPKALQSHDLISPQNV
jgi:hypothetical protein